jgi:hypothetical protein
MSQALQQLSAIALVVVVVPPILARLVPSTALGRLSARLRDEMFRLLA